MMGKNRNVAAGATALVGALVTAKIDFDRITKTLVHYYRMRNFRLNSTIQEFLGASGLNLRNFLLH